MSANPRVTVVLIVYNRPVVVRRAIESILAQTFEDFELLIVDDGSTDDTPAVLAEYADRDPRVVVYTLPANMRTGFARHTGVALARGEYVAIMDSDDVAYPGRLAAQVAFMDEHPGVTVCGGRAIKVLPDDQRTRMDMPTDDATIKASLLHVDRALVHSTVMLRRQFLRDKRVNYDAQRVTDDDYDFYTRLVPLGARFAAVEEVVLDYHRDGNNNTASAPTLQMDKLPLRDRLLGAYFPDLSHRESRALAAVMQQQAHVSIAEACLGVAAGLKAIEDHVTRFGEDRVLARRIVGQAVVRMREYLASRSGQRP